MAATGPIQAPAVALLPSRSASRIGTKFSCTTMTTAVSPEARTSPRSAGLEYREDVRSQGIADHHEAIW